MRKNSSKLDKLPQPLTISKKLNLRKGLDQPNPYRIGQEVKENKLSTSRRHSGLAEMKQELMQIKDDMIKLFTPTNEDPVDLTSPPDILHEALKQELNQQKLSEEKLKKQIEKNKLDYNKSIEQLHNVSNSKIDQLKRDKENIKIKYQKAIQLKGNEIKQLKQRFLESESHFKNLLSLEKSKYESLNGEFDNLQNIIKQLKSGNSEQEQRIIEGIELKKANIELSTQLQSITMELQSYKSINFKLNEEIKHSSIRQVEARNSVSILENNQMSLLERLKEAEEQSQSNLEVNNQQLNTQRMEIINLELTINDLQQQNYVLTEHNKYIKNILNQTEDYIKALEAQLNNYITVSKNQYRKSKKQL